MRDLYPHQTKAVEMLRESIRQGNKRIVLAAPCSFGKTQVASYMIERAIEKGKRCGFIVDRVELIDQAVDRFDEDGIDLGVLQGNHWRTNGSKPCQVATIQTLGRRKTQDFDFCIIDECHVLHKTHKRYMEMFNNIIFIGLSASPFTKGLGLHFQDLVVPITTAELIQMGALCDYECFAPPYTLDMSKVKTKAGDWEEKSLSKVVDDPKIIGDIVTTHQRLAKGRPTVVFAVNIAHSKHICEEFKKVGLRAAHVDCYTDKDTRKIINDQFKDGMIDILSCVAIFEKGWDAPIASCLIQAAPTKSVMRYVQQVGRILRTHPDKDKAIILDHAGNTTYHGWVEEIIPNELCTKEKKDQEVIKKEKKKATPTVCEKCGFLKDSFVCSACGHKPEYIQNVEIADGELEKKTKQPKATKEEKELWYSMFLYYARDKGKKDGWAYFKTREKFGTALAGTKHIKPVKPTEEVLKYIKYLNIKWAKGKAKEKQSAPREQERIPDLFS